MHVELYKNIRLVSIHIFQYWRSIAKWKNRCLNHLCVMIRDAIKSICKH